MRAVYSEDKYGNLVTLTDVGELNIRAIIAEGLSDLYVEYLQALEEWFNLELHRRSVESGKLIGRQDVLTVEKLGVFQFDLASMSLFHRATLSATHYPESTAMISSCGNGAMAIWAWNNFIRPFIPERTKMKIRALGTEFTQALVEGGIEIENLPKRWGGLKRDTDWDRLFEDEDNMDEYSSFVVSSRALREIRLAVKEKDTTVKYSWTLAAHTIAFESYFLVTGAEGGGERVQVQPKETMKANYKEGEEGGGYSFVFKAPSQGDLVLLFDNTEAYLRTKSIRYTACKESV